MCDTLVELTPELDRLSNRWVCSIVSDILGCSFNLRLLLFATGHQRKFVHGSVKFEFNKEAFRRELVCMPRTYSELLKLIGKWTRHPNARGSAWIA